MTEAPSHDDHGFGALTAKITRDRGFGCASYKEKCLRRRIAVRMRARGVHTYADYMRVLDGDPVEYDRLIDALTINVTKLFRNWDCWAALERTVLPSLLARPGELRIWSAGCASGEESYSIAVLLHRVAERTAALDRIDHARVVGTDIDRASLLAAERGQFTEMAFAETPPAIRERYFTAAPPFTVSPEIRRLVRFERRDLLAEPPPHPALDLIVCRNVLIYFDRATQESLLAKFHDALAPGSYLMLGKVETLLGGARQRYTAVEPRERIFRRS